MASARLHAVQDASSQTERTSVVPTAQACSSSWGAAGREIATVLTVSLGRVSRPWMASQIGRASSLVEEWFRLDVADKRPAPLKLLIARRADGRGHVLSDAEFERVVEELRRLRGVP